MASSPSIDTLPPELTIIILSHLDSISLCMVGASCRTLRAVCQHESLWNQRACFKVIKKRLFKCCLTKSKVPFNNAAWTSTGLLYDALPLAGHLDACEAKKEGLVDPIKHTPLLFPYLITIRNWMMLARLSDLSRCMAKAFVEVNDRQLNKKMSKLFSSSTQSEFKRNSFIEDYSCRVVRAACALFYLEEFTSHIRPRALDSITWFNYHQRSLCALRDGNGYTFYQSPFPRTLDLPPIYLGFWKLCVIHGKVTAAAAANSAERSNSFEDCFVYKVTFTGWRFKQWALIGNRFVGCRFVQCAFEDCVWWNSIWDSCVFEDCTFKLNNDDCVVVLQYDPAELLAALGSHVQYRADSLAAVHRELLADDGPCLKRAKKQKRKEASLSAKRGLQ